jgi:CRISPR-associated endonuclease Csn1
LKETLKNKYGFKVNHLPFLLNITYKPIMGVWVPKLLKKILPHMMDGHIYNKVCLLSGYNHLPANYWTNNDRVLKDTLELLVKKEQPT